MGDYLRRTTAGLKEAIAVNSSTGTGDADKIVKLNAQGKINDNMLPSGVGEDTFQAEASESLAAGDFINLFDDAGVLKMRKADASNNRRAHGFVRLSVNMGESGAAYGAGYINDQLTGLTQATTYYLGETAGGVATSGPASAANVIHQEVGFAFSATELYFVPKDPVELI